MNWGWLAGWLYRHKVDRTRRRIKQLDRRQRELVREQDREIRAALASHVRFLDYLTEQSQQFVYPQDYRQQYADWFLRQPRRS